MGFTDQRSASRFDASAAHCEVLLPLFDGPIGRASVGRMALGDVDSLVLLREIGSGDIERLAPLIAQLRAVADPSVSGVLGLVADGPNAYVACEYVHAITLFELLQLAPLPAAVLVRILHDALRAAERFGGCWHASAPIRYLFTDTIWISTDGNVVLSEPAVAARLANEVPNSLIRGRGYSRNSVDSHRTDTLAALELLRQLWVGAGITSDEAARNTLRTACSAPGFGSAERGDMARRLAALPPGLIASCQLVGNMVQTAAGAILRTRRQHLQQSPFFGDETTDEEETACINVADLRDDFGSAEHPIVLEAPRASSKHSFDAPEPWLADSEQDEQEVTSAFRPSDLPRLLAGAATQRQAARAPQSHRFRPSPSESPPEVYDRPTAAPPRFPSPTAFDAARFVAPTAALDAAPPVDPPAAFAAPHSVEPSVAFAAPHARAASSGSDAAPSLEAGPILDVDLATLLALDRSTVTPPSDPPADSAELRSLRPSQPIPLQRIVDDPDVRAELKRAHWRRVRAISVSLALAALGVAGLLLSTYG